MNEKDPKFTPVDAEVRKKLDLYKQVFSTPAGREVFEDMKKSFYYRSSFDQSNSHVTAFREGQRDVVIRIDNILKTFAGEKKKPKVMKER